MATSARAQAETILVYGDSLVSGPGLSPRETFPARLEARLLAEGRGVKVINAGAAGETTSGGLTRLEWTLDQHNPGFVILVLGGNDMLRALPPAVTRKNLGAMLEILKKRRIPTLLAGMKTFRNLSPFNDSFQDIYEDLAEEYEDDNVILYPFFLQGVALESRYNQPDGIHPNAAGVDVIVDNIYPDVEDLLEKK